MTKTVDLILAHPYPDRSRANQVLFDAVKDLPFVGARSLYDLYPDFAIDTRAEQEALAAADVVVFQHPIYWYTVPALLKLWWEKVLARGWAYGEGGHALRGKRCQWVVTSGGDDAAFSHAGIHGHPFSAFVPVVEQTARFCGMSWEPPLVVTGAHRIARGQLEEFAKRYRETLLSFAERAPS